MTAKAKVRRKPQATLLSSVRKKVTPRVGDTARIEGTAKGTLLSPGVSVDRAQAWFWSKRWQAEERKVEKDIRAKRLKVSKSVDAFLKDLEK